MSEFPALQTQESPGEIRVTGGTFSYAFSRTTGLVTSAQVRGEEWLAGPLPDLWASPEVDPRPRPFRAAHTPEAKVRLVRAGAEQVVIEAQGRFARIDGASLPLQYELLYTLDIDGTIQVDVRVTPLERIELRWLTLAEAQIRGAACRFFSREGDVSETRTTCRPVSVDLDGLSPEAGRDGAAEPEIDQRGRFIPWFHFGNDRAGLELVFPHSHLTQAGWTDSSPYASGDPLGRAGDRFVLQRAGENLRCTAYAIRNLREVLSPERGFADTFYVSAVPGRLLHPAANSLQIQWIGPHQYRSGWRPPGEEAVKRWVAGGVNTVVGGANWFSGDYSRCDRPEETRRFLELCHRYGLRVMPYITFTDLEYGAPAFEAHGHRWRIDPVAEFNYRSQLMCYGAEEWQQHWQREVEQLFTQFDFDGLYIDFWAGKLNCYNGEHGCAGPFGRFTAPGLRKMARFAYDLVRSSTQDGLIMANTNILPLAMINNWFHVRLYGEWHNLERTDPLALRIFYNSHRFGTGNVILVRRVPQITERTLALAALFQGCPVLSHARSEAERAVLEQDALLKRAFGAEQAQALNHYETEAAVKAALASEADGAAPGVSLYYHPTRREMLAAVSTFGRGPARVRLGELLRGVLSSLGANERPARWQLFVVETGQLFEGGSLQRDESSWDSYWLELPADALRHLWLRPAAGGPALLYALGAAGPVEPRYDAKSGIMEVMIPSQVRESAQAVFLGAAPTRIEVQGREVPFVRGDGWWKAELPCNNSVSVVYERKELP